MKHSVTNTQENKKIHPQKFALWIAIGSIIMMFAGFTSGFIVRKSQGNWEGYKLPIAFYISTAVILLSSFTIHLAVKSMRNRQISDYKKWVGLTLLFGLLFTALQYWGFYELFAVMQWQNNVPFQFLLVIVLVHALHILGGVVAMIYMYLRTFNNKYRSFSPVGIEMMATYWHFVDILWLYLLVFFLIGL